MTDFAKSIANFAHKTGQNLDETIKFSCIALFRSIILDTPIDEGRLRSNWFCTLNRPSTRALNNKSGVYFTDDKIIGDMTAKVNSAKEGATYYLTNNMPYAYRIEYEGYSKTKAPQGMVRINVGRMSAILDAEAAKVSK